MRAFICTLMCLFFGFSQSHAAPAPEEFGKLPAIYDAAISPDASRYAMFANIDGAYGIWIFSEENPDEKPKLVMLGEGVKPKWIKWANNDRVLAAIWQSEKIRATPVTTGYIYTLDVNTMKGKILIKPPRDMIRQYNDQVIDFLENDPDYILMSFSDTKVFAPDIQKVNVATGASKRIRRGRETVQSWYTDLRGEPRIGQGLLDSTSERKWRLIIRDKDEDTWRDADEFPGLRPDADIYGFAKNPDEMIIGHYAGKDTQGLYIYDLSRKKMTRKLFHHDTYDASGIVLNGDGSDIAGATFVADSNETELFDDYGSVLSRMKEKFPTHTIDYVDQSSDGEIVLFEVSHAYDPGALMRYKQSTDDVKAIAYMYKGLPSDDMGSVISVNYTARDGEKIPAYVTLPPSVVETSQIKNLPFIILPHGGPYARSSQRFDYFAQFFASRGFGVLQMNFRGSAGYGKSFKEAGRKNWVVMQEDVEDGTRWLMDKGYADPKRTCIAGWSYGGYAALMGAINNPELYACSISMAGVTDLQDMIRDIKQYRFGKIAAKDFVLKGFEDKDAIKENSPVKRAEEYTVPLFLAHGTKDQRVHFDQFKRMKRALKKSPAKVTYMEFEDEDHFLSNQKNRQKFFIGLDKFLKDTVGVSEHMK